jgi:hypothetical protein
MVLHTHINALLFGKPTISTISMSIVTMLAQAQLPAALRRLVLPRCHV